ncbi:HABP4_PAI-RBP1 domain-containing protein, partial [Meloidogyne graminicola]
LNYYDYILNITIKTMEYGVQTHNKFAFLDGRGRKKKAAALPSKKISKPVSAKVLVTKETVKQVVEKKSIADLPQKQAVKFGPGEERPPGRGGTQRRGGTGGWKGGGGRDRNFRQGEGRRPQSGENKEENKEEKNVEVTENKTWDDSFAPNEKIDDQKENSENVPKDEEKKEEGIEEPQLPRGKTYEEWKTEQKAVEAAQFKTRQAGEGADENIYQKLVPLKIDKTVTDANKQDDIQDEFYQNQHKEKREKTISVDLAFAGKRSSFNRQDYGGGGSDRQGQRSGPRGPGRGGGSGGAGSSRRQQGKSAQDGFMLENDQFPALGSR